MDILSHLNPEQIKAVQATEGPVLILAGPGSGKTRVIAHRVAYLITEKRISPYNILAVTFTNKAAGEMKERIAKLLGRPQEEKGEILPFLGTFHSVCVKILRSEIKNLGFKSNFAIYDEDDQKTAVKKVEERIGIDIKQYTPEMILNHISGAKNELMTPAQYGRYVSSFFNEIVYKVYLEYQKLLKENQALDFDDLIMKTVELFTKFPQILAKYQNRSKYIMVDEYQDTNRAQYVLVKLLAKKHKNICVVGDDSQAIYGWRGADIRNILNFEDDFPKAKIFKLEQNYRSTKNILAAAQEVISKNLLRKDKEIWTENEEGLPVVLYEAQNEKDEAKFIIREIEAMLKDPKSSLKGLKDFVVLYRTNAQSRALEEMFLKYNLPYKIVGGLRFYERKEIKDIVAFLRLIYNPTDTFSAERIINIPSRGITQKTWQKIADIWKKKATNLENLKKAISKIKNLNPRAKKAVSHFIDLLGVFKEAGQKLNPVELIDFVIKGTGYKDYILDGTIEGESRWENIQELKSVAENFVEFPPADGLAAFLEEVSLVAEIDEWDPNVSAVTLMTAHNAKGLEFGCVFMVGMEEGLFPHSRSLLEPAELEEERRLCYVGMTRAKKRLYLIYAKSRLLYGGIQVNAKSRFLDNIPEELIINNEQKKVLSKNIKSLTTNQQPLTTIFKSGDRVLHPKFGQGIVVQVDGDILKVAFTGLGVRKLSASIAPLTKI